MALTVNSAFNEFNRDFVNLDPNRTNKAIDSREWLWGQLNKLQLKDNLNFPLMYGEKHIKFGSFARKTKIRPLDDIDLMFCLSADGAYYSKYNSTYQINTHFAGSRLTDLSDDNILNSRRVVNKFVSSLNEIEHYKKAEVHRRGEAATLKLSSYEWNFDIVPCFYTDTGLYLIPDGDGDWKATDPRVDQKRVTDANKANNGNLLQLIRTLKYWNNHHSSYKIGSYLFEQIIIHYVQYRNNSLSNSSLDISFFFGFLPRLIYKEIQDPKGIQGNLNQLSNEQRKSICDKASCAQARAMEAFNAEQINDHNKAINIWREIFGSNFPKYE